MPSFDQHLREFFSKPRTMEAQLLTPKARVVEDMCAVKILAFLRRNSNVVPVDLQKMISHFAGNTPAGVPLWAAVVAPQFFKDARPFLRKHMWTASISSGGHGDGRTDVYQLHLRMLSLASSEAAALRAMWQLVMKHKVLVRYECRFRNGRTTKGGSIIKDVNYNATAVQKYDGYWMQIQSSNATPRFEYYLCTEPNYD